MDLLVTTDKGAPGLEGRDVGPAAEGPDGVWAIVDGSELWHRAAEWKQVGVTDGPACTCVLPIDNEVLVGTAEAHVARWTGSTLEAIEAFDALPDRSRWYTPWGDPPDTRSMAATADGQVLVNIHVGGLALAADGLDQRWRALVDIDVDVHQVVVAPDGSFLVATGAAGFGRSTDGGAHWSWDAEGLHGGYCRAVAVAGDHVLLTASPGPHGQIAGAVYRRPLGATGEWERVSDFVDGNIDTFWLVADGDEAAFATDDGRVFMSTDAGTTWSAGDPAGGRPRSLVLL